LNIKWNTFLLVWTLTAKVKNYINLHKENTTEVMILNFSINMKNHVLNIRPNRLFNIQNLFLMDSKLNSNFIIF